ncbi:S-glutathionyl-(chloro)hydroquinone reductase [Mortierella sp. GBA30]|nr:S-glutathionyl-(chloro)hydroquinone reductase [Mortierella sp. GBA30]
MTATLNSSAATETNDSSLKLKLADADGEFRRQVSSFRDWVKDDPEARFPAEKNRYHLYVSYGCPWAHRTLVVRALKGLEDIISVDQVHWYLDERGWQFKDGFEDSLFGSKFLSEIYRKAEPSYNARFTVPVLWDKKTGTIVNNESSDIIRMFNTAFDRFVPEKAGINYYPDHLKAEIDSVNEWIYDTVNNGVYKCGFATAQEAYDNHVYPLFKSLDKIEDMLSKADYLVGNTLTEADIRLWTTIVRFDPAYHGHFKCNIKGIEKDYPNILRWARRIYQLPKVGETVNMDIIKKGYYNAKLARNAIRAKYRPGSLSGSDDDSLSNRDLGVDGYDSGPEVEAADMQTHIPESNVGYRLLLKMGWKAGTGLGQNSSGRTAPIEIERKQDVLGLGKQAVDTWYAEASTAKRKTLEVERQAEETEEEKSKRELQVQQQMAVQAELEMVKSAFYCALCDKQYERISDYEVHLSSYDHNHKKRFKDMKDTSRASAAGTTNKIKEKERRREEKELAKMQEAALKRVGAKAPSVSTPDSSLGSATLLSRAPSLGTGGFQPVRLSGFQPVQQTGFQPASTPVPSTTATIADPSSGTIATKAAARAASPEPSSGFQLVKLGGFQPVKLGGFQPVKNAGGFQPVKLGGFQSAEDDNAEDSAPTTTSSSAATSTSAGTGGSPSPSGFQPVKLGGFKPMKIGAFQLKKPGSK